MSRQFAIGADGKKLPYSEADIKQIVGDAVQEGRLLAAILETRGGDLAVPVYGPPSRDLLKALEAAAVAYRKALYQAGELPNLLNPEIARDLLGMERKAFERQYHHDAAFHALCHVVAQLWIERES